WMQWFTRVASWASVINVLVASLGFYWPAVTTGALRSALIAGIIAVLTTINILGIRQSAVVLNTLTAGKLAPLAIFIVAGWPAFARAAGPRGRRVHGRRQRRAGHAGRGVLDALQQEGAGAVRFAQPVRARRAA